MIYYLTEKVGFMPKDEGDLATAGYTEIFPGLIDETTAEMLRKNVGPVIDKYLEPQT